MIDLYDKVSGSSVRKSHARKIVTQHLDHNLEEVRKAMRVLTGSSAFRKGFTPNQNLLIRLASKPSEYLYQEVQEMVALLFSDEIEKKPTNDDMYTYRCYLAAIIQELKRRQIKK